jgi:hypothetical protein
MSDSRRTLAVSTGAYALWAAFYWGQGVEWWWFWPIVLVLKGWRIMIGDETP